VKGKKKPTKKELEKIQDNYYKKLPESELNPNAKEDFERVLGALFPPIKKKGVKK
jgi:hypothetical protein